MPLNNWGKPEPERFWMKVAPPDENGCLLWTAGQNGRGYGQFRVGSQRDGTRRFIMAHRWAYEESKGPIPNGLCIDHLCRVRLCQNAEHMEAVTQRENLLRGNGMSARHAIKTACPQGHPYSHVDRFGARRCRQCNTDQSRRRYQQKVGA